MNVQTQQVLDMLRLGPVTRFDAHDSHILNITARITDLRDMGFEIVCNKITDPNHHSGKTKFGQWVLISEPHQYSIV